MNSNKFEIFFKLPDEFNLILSFALCNIKLETAKAFINKGFESPAISREYFGKDTLSIFTKIRSLASNINVDINRALFQICFSNKEIFNKYFENNLIFEALKTYNFSQKESYSRYQTAFNSLLSVALTNQNAHDTIFKKATPAAFFDSYKPYLQSEKSLNYVKSVLIQRSMFKQGAETQTWKNNFSNEIELNAPELNDSNIIKI